MTQNKDSRVGSLKLPPEIRESLDQLALEDGKMQGKNPSLVKWFRAIIEGEVPVLSGETREKFAALAAKHGYERAIDLLLDLANGKLTIANWLDAEWSMTDAEWSVAIELVRLGVRFGMADDLAKIWEKLQILATPSRSHQLVNLLPEKPVAWSAIEQFIAEKQPFGIIRRNETYTVRYAEFCNRYSEHQNKMVRYLDCWVEETEFGKDSLFPEPESLKHNRTFKLTEDEIVSQAPGVAWREEGLDSLMVQFCLLPNKEQIARFNINRELDLYPVMRENKFYFQRKVKSWFWTWQRDLIRRWPYIQIITPIECAKLVTSQMVGLN